MEAEIVKQGEVGIELASKNIEVSEYGLNFTGQLTIEEWHNAVLSLQKFDGKVQWYLGDLAAYALSPVTGWGESKYTDLINSTGYAEQTLRWFASVARRFPPQLREDLLKHVAMSQHISFNHFREVAPLDDNFAGYWLQKAAENGWGVAKLREEIKRWKAERGEVAEPQETPIGIISFKEVGRRLLKDFTPLREDVEYDDVAWLLEMKDWVDVRLEQYGIIEK